MIYGLEEDLKNHSDPFSSLRTDRPNFYKYLLPYYSKQDYIKWIPEDIERIKAEIEKSKKVLIKE